MKITAESHTYDGTGRAGFTPLDPITTQARTRAGILKAWSKAVSAEYARKIKFQEDHRETVEKLDAIAINGVWIVEGHASEGPRRYRMTATAEQGSAPVCAVFEIGFDYDAYRTERERLHELKEKYRAI